VGGAAGASRPGHPFPRLRWLAPIWLAVYVPTYAISYGWANFLFLCNVGIILAAVGLWTANRVLLSASAVASLVVGGIWSVDYASRLLSGSHLLGVTSYMWDPQYPWFARMLSFYHVVWPLLMLACVARLGYDRRGWSLQAALAVALVFAGRFAGGAAENINFAWADPVWSRQLGPPAVHLLTIAAAASFGIFGASHAVLAARFERAATLDLRS